MENSNSREYLEKITSAVIDNLRHTVPAPSVQMQDVPRKPFGGMTDEEEAELDDLDEDENKDVRMTEHRWDKHVEHDAEFEASDDDDMARSNGATRQKSVKQPFTDYRKSEMEVDSGNVSPVNDTNGDVAEGPAGDDSHDVNDDTIEDLSTHEQPEMENPEREQSEKQTEKVIEKVVENEVEETDKTGAVEETKKPEDVSKETEKSNVDDDGDVGMADPDPTEETTTTTTTIKKEEVDPEPTTKAASVEKATQEEPAVEKATAASENNAAETKTVDESVDKSTEVEPETKVTESREEAKNEESAEAMDVDTEKEKAPETREKSKSPAS